MGGTNRYRDSLVREVTFGYKIATCFHEGQVLATALGALPCSCMSPQGQYLDCPEAHSFLSADLRCLPIWRVKEEFGWFSCLSKQHVTTINNSFPALCLSKPDFIISPIRLTSPHWSKERCIQGHSLPWGQRTGSGWVCSRSVRLTTHRQCLATAGTVQSWPSG